MNHKDLLPQKIGDSAFFFFDLRDYLAVISEFDPALANQTIAFESESSEDESAPEPSED